MSEIALKSVTNWRDVLPIHPAAKMFPPLSSDDLAALAANIKFRGQQQAVAIFHQDVDRAEVLDGVNRLDALMIIGAPIIKDGDLDPDVVKIEHVPGNVDPYDFVISANLHRRHLTSEQKRTVIEALLKAKPEQSNRQIAKKVKADHKTVAAVRADCEAGGEIPHLDKVVGTDGKNYPTQNTAPEINEVSGYTDHVEVEQPDGNQTETEATDKVVTDHPVENNTDNTAQPKKTGQITSRDEALLAFTASFCELHRRISSHHPSRFARTTVAGDDLIKLGKFLIELAQFKAAIPGCNPNSGVQP
jgi:hypothetical protein